MGKPPSTVTASAVTPSTAEQVTGAVDTAVKEWLSTQEFADWIGVSIDTVYWWNKTGTGPKRHRLGKELRFRRCDIEEWLRTRCVEPV